jgi:hypothetical protein
MMVRVNLSRQILFKKHRQLIFKMTARQEILEDAERRASKV